MHGNFYDQFYIMRQLVLGLLLACFAFVEVNAQSIRITERGNTRSFSYDQFYIAGHKVDISELGLTNSGRSSLNKVTAVSGVIGLGKVTLYSGSGKKITEVPYSIGNGDDSIKLYVKPDGGFILRENIANFLFFGPNGKIQNSISNSSQSPEGEAVSELSADPMFKTVVLYNPKIIRNGGEQSRARVIDNRGNATEIFYDSDRAIKEIFVSNNGQFIAIVTMAQGSDDRVEVMDRFGNDLADFTFNQNINGIEFSSDGRYITIHSNSRVGVYSLITGEREGSTSFRNMLQYASFVPSDKNIIAITAEETGNKLSDVEFHAINLSARSIERQEYNGALGISDLLPISMERTGSNTYMFMGLNKVLNVSISF